MSKTKHLSSSPLLSVVSPVYNGERFLLPFIQSVIDQSMEEWELIIVDDGSTDNSALIAEEQASLDSRIRVVRAEHKNAGNARNIGFQHVRGEYTCFLDSDDICKPDMFKKMFEKAKEKKADIVICFTESYSQRTKCYTSMNWAVWDAIIPKTEDGCYNRFNCGEYLFQSCIISPWNKMISTELIRKNNIRAQSQIAANDVVLSCTALACAEKIYILREILYTQRRDYTGSITSNLGTEEKCMCGYTASLGLKNELIRLGVYEELRETYQRLAIHNCIWYLDKQYANVSILQNYYEFLNKEGFSKLDLDELEIGILNENSNDYKMFVEVRKNEFVNYLYQVVNSYREREAANKDKLARIENAYEKVRNSKDYTIGRKFIYPLRKVKNIRKSINRATTKHKKRNKYRTAEKRIAILAFEKYHYEVVGNIMQICNLDKNYIVAYVNNEAKREISQMIGKERSELVEWHTYSKPSIKPTIDKFESSEKKRMLFVEDVQKREGLDCIIVPSVEYHPEWYGALSTLKREDVELIIGIHNINYIFANERKGLLKSFLENADSYFVIDGELKNTLASLGVNKKVYLFPPLYGLEGITREERDKEPVVFTVTGAVDSNRKDYEIVIDAIKTIPELYPYIKLVLLGNADNDYGKDIYNQLKELETNGLQYEMFFKRIPQEVFDEKMERTDCIIGPVVVKTKHRETIEYYGQTKASGIIGDVIKYGLPAIITDEMIIPEDLKDSVVTYNTKKGLTEAIKTFIDPFSLEKYKERAIENSEKYTLEKLKW